MSERTRINVRGDDGSLLGWFILESAERFLEDVESPNGYDRISVNTRSERTHQTLYRTAKGQWVLEDWDDYADSISKYQFIGDDAAEQWLILNKEDAAVKQYFSDLEEEAGPNVGGRPSIGPRVDFRLPQEVLDRVTKFRGSREQADALRVLVVAGLDSLAPEAEGSSLSR